MRISTRLTNFLIDTEITEDMNLPYQEHFMKRESYSNKPSMFDYLFFLQTWLKIYFQEERTYSLTEYLDFIFFRNN